ncbi:DUF4142 domain-containing protein [Rhodopseudomonas palustris]|uniref:DUF4142 domain-containing protein n=1 Tax=Rhodopseudomonas palustris TaxID=1076 RepID=A0A418VQL1_RHOPL|nr:DUF4142 domain-containing protein [Rhodopseudomonas palustris]RJF78633.1 DUF4142 domain-containing protein [Rhodopseudomonas palustris]
MIRLIAGLVAILPAIVVFAGAIAGSETPRKRSLLEDIGFKRLFGWPPNEHDVLRLLHEFNMVQLRSYGLAETRGDERIRQFAATQAEQARQREIEIGRLNMFGLLNINFAPDPSLIRRNELAGLQGEVGAAFIRDYLDNQKEDIDGAIGLLRRYLLHPDNDDVRRFAKQQLPQLEQAREELLKLK